MHCRVVVHQTTGYLLLFCSAPIWYQPWTLSMVQIVGIITIAGVIWGRVFIQYLDWVVEVNYSRKYGTCSIVHPYRIRKFLLLLYFLKLGWRKLAFLIPPSSLIWLKNQGSSSSKVKTNICARCVNFACTTLGSHNAHLLKTFSNG